MENPNLLIENIREKLSVKPSDNSFQEEEPKEIPFERAASKDKNSLRLPVINSKKNGMIEKEN